MKIKPSLETDVRVCKRTFQKAFRLASRGENHSAGNHEHRDRQYRDTVSFLWRKKVKFHLHFL